MSAHSVHPKDASGVCLRGLSRPEESGKGSEISGHSKVAP